MNFHDNFVSVCNLRNEYPTKVCESCGLSPTAYTKWNKSIPNSATIIKIATHLNCSTDKLLLGKDPVTNPEHQQMIDIYEQLSPDNKDMAVKMFAAFFNIQTERENKRKHFLIKHSLYKASAGKGYNLDDEDMWEKIRVSDTELVHEADFSLTVEGDSMSPVFSDGDIVLIKQCETVNIGDICIYIVNGDSYIKEFGGDRLISLNPKYKDIVFSADDSIKCCGKVIGKATIV